jgi:DNA-binding response OmpR family regulator
MVSNASEQQLRVVVVEDDPDLSEEIAWRLNETGMQVTACPDAKSFHAHIAEHHADVVVLDLGLPDEDGLSIAKKLSQHEDMRIVILTARAMVEDRIAGFEAGGDVYLTKPVDLAELSSVVQRLGVRLPGHIKTTWRLDTTRAILTIPEIGKVELTTKENIILQKFAEAPKQTVTRSVLVKALWGREDPSTDQRLMVNMSRLRAKLNERNDDREVIRTCWQVGYQFIYPLSLKA